MEPQGTVGQNLRRGGARLRALGKAHSPLHVMLWQAREAQNAVIAAATAQKMLFTDIAAWASKENRALSDVCTCASELSSIYTSAQMNTALAYKSFRKDMKMILEGEKRRDAAHKKLQEAEAKRLKLRRQVLRIQSKRTESGENPKQGDLAALQTQLAQAERSVERLHIESCNATTEQEATKLVLLRSSLAKLADSHVSLAAQIKLVFEAEREITKEIPEPPPPGDSLTGIVYAGHDTTRAVLERVKSQIRVSPNANQLNTSAQSTIAGPPRFASTPTTTPNRRHAASSHEPSAPRQSVSEEGDLPPPYNAGLFRSCFPLGEEAGNSGSKRSATATAGSSESSKRRAVVGRNLRSRASVTPDPSPTASATTIRNRSSSPYGSNPPMNPFYIETPCRNCTSSNDHHDQHRHI